MYEGDGRGEDNGTETVKRIFGTRISVPETYTRTRRTLREEMGKMNPLITNRYLVSIL